jgi:ABC-2 type transport system ATP-binding protein
MSLNLANVVKKFGDKLAVDNVSFKMDKPGIFGLLGTNGAGKTTTIRMMLGILSKDQGTIEWKGKPIKKEYVKFGYLPEERGIYAKAKVREQLIYFAKLHGLDSKAAKNSVDYWLERVKLQDYSKKMAEQLSKGNQQKLQLITTLAHDPELVILDEPFSGLDPINTELFKGIIDELVKKDKYIVMSSHQMPVVEEYCNDILILKNGNTVLQGNLREIKRSYGRTNLYIECDGDIEGLAEEQGVKLQAKTALDYEFKIQSDEQAYKLLEKIISLRLRLDKFEIREPSLHEIFIEKVGE